MRLFAANYRLLGWITLILIGGFITTTGAAFVASRDAIEHSISQQALPLTGDLIHAGLQKDILYPVFISSMMAQDPVVRDWLADVRSEPALIQSYLDNIKLKYGTVASFIGSEQRRMLYHTYGRPNPIEEGRQQDEWFFRMRAMAGKAYETNIEIDAQYSGQPTLFLNHRVTDRTGLFLGVAGVAITLDTMNQVLARYQARYERKIYFVNDSGKVMLSGVMLNEEESSLERRSGMKAIAPAILNRSTTPTSLAYRDGQSDVLVNSRYVPELNWYLVVEQSVSGNGVPLTRLLTINFLISLAVTLLVLVVTLLTVNRFQRRLEKMATTDALTGLLNRQALTVLFRQSTLVSKRNGQPLSAILFDIDHFKSVNDRFGHLAGDSVIRQVAAIALEVVRESDLVTRWGGEEYLVLLGDCKLSKAITMAENLRRRVAEHDFGLPGAPVITISLGVAQHRDDESENAFFKRTDDALYGAKHGGRNYTNASYIHPPAPQLF
ncbi:sensor domain-containing diguanylate cyclase [Massilia sp. PAMC28688]|uniref:sensor domain-containing diguanylate cyclase n=1 Tax=Massilia sp. PAMC28688 TaxID=2861283 RepID=UPI001C63769F|nr:sensor domain-containing diguanylate cyclase [Massilia sp. PAMC28688]QYF95126.1 sensor domain-containing diguanylate cyclase [Massilia sp. PAMC28688]